MNLFLIAQIVSIGYIITTIIALLYKEKFKVMFWFFLANIMLLTTYLLLGRYLASLLVIGAGIRTLIFYLYSKKNMKPNIGIFVSFEAYFIITSILLFNDIFDLLMLINLAMLTYTTWQNNMFTLRLGYLFSSIILITYDAIVGAYVAIISEVILLIIAIISIYKNDFKNKIKDIVYDFYSTISPTYDIDIKEFENYRIITSKTISDNFNNFIYYNDLKNFDNHNNIINNKFLPIYIYNDNADNIIPISILCKNNKIIYNDVWMKLKTQDNFLPKKCILKNVECKKCNETNKNEIIKVFTQGFIHNTTDNIYKLSNEYSLNYQNKIEKNYFINHNITPYIAFYENNAIGLLFMYKQKERAYICQITTIPKHRKKGVASLLLYYAIKEEQKCGIQDFYLVTEKNTFLESFYIKNNFEEIGQGFCFYLNNDLDIHNIKKQELLNEIKDLEHKLKIKRNALSKLDK